MDLQNKDTLFSNFFIQKNAFVHHESAWKGHIALSQWLVWKLRPQVFVELGVQHGTSYFSFCQRIAEEHLGTRCYAVDTWKGDENTGEYTEHIFTNVSEYNKAYSDFSTLIRSKFAEALPRFEDRSIDILHIDGAHVYEAVKEDFSLYLPKVSDKGIVLLHDSAERGEGFGVWRFVDELTSKYPCFSFKHSHGLTIIAIGSRAPGLLGDLLALDISDEEKAGICSAFEQLNHLCLFQAPPDQRVYPRLGLDFGGGFTRGGEFKYCSSSNNIRIHQNFSEILHLKQFYVQPLWGSCILQFTSCCVTLLNGKQVFLSPERSTGYSIGPYYFFETNTPQFYFAVNEAIKEITVSFFLVGDTEMLMAVKGNALQNTFRAYKADTETRLEDLEKTLIAAREKNAALMQSDHERDTELAQTQNDLAAAYTEAHALRGERDAAHAELTQTQNDLAVAYAEAHALRGERDAAHAELTQTQNDLAAAYAEAHALRGERDAAHAELAQTQNDLAAAYTETHALRGERDAAHAELAQTQNDLAAAYTETHTLRDERDAAYAELAQTQNELAAAYTEAHALRGERDAAHAELTQTQNDLAVAYAEAHALRGERDAAEKHVAELHHSLSWAVTAPLRLTYDILAWPYRTVASFNMRRTLFSLRYSRVGGALYNTCLSQAIKNRINRAWSGETLAPSYPVAIPQPVATLNSQPTVSESPNGHREPVFIPDPAWYEEKRPLPIPADCPVKIIAFYLPQFHPIPENDAWWGEGFTEWTNVTKARPLFDGHYQPKLPGAMGFYDLRLPEVLRKQAALAKEFGIHGFCFHHYYFAGKRLLETPVNNLLANPDIDLPFCLCWANENWTRRWDGMEQDILISQNHSPEDDICFLEDIQKYFDDPRYIRVEGKPFLIVYKPNQFPDMAKTIHRWRKYAATKGEQLYLVMAQTFGEKDPRPYGFDAAVEFPPHNLSTLPHTTVHNSSLSFSGIIYDAAKIYKYVDNTEYNYKKFLTVFPSWDNTARKGTSAHIYSGITPEVYGKWLGKALQHTRKSTHESAPFIFVNAWNEWAEGAYLEPDKIYGYAYLNATSRELNNLLQQNPSKKIFNSHSSQLKVLFIAHDFYRAGAQIWLLTLLKWLTKYTKNLYYVLCINSEGPLKEEFSSLCNIICYNEIENSLDDIKKICNGSPDIIYGNTVVSAKLYDFLSSLRVKFISHIHELQNSIEMYTTQHTIDNLLKYTNTYIAASEAVKQNLIKNYKINTDNIKTINEFINSTKIVLSPNEKYLLRTKLGLPPDACIVLGCGSRTMRKGTDIFVRLAAQKSIKNTENIYFCWVGWGENNTVPSLDELITNHRLFNTVKLVPEQENPSAYFLAADIFALTSREDPFPLVCLEAADAALPIVCFAHSGGMPDFVQDDAGIIVPYLDEKKFADALARLAKNTTLRSCLGVRAREKLLFHYTDDSGAPQVLALIRKMAKKPHPVSVIVPNYNYAQYLEQRLSSIASQTYRDFECLLLDDASTDESVSLLKKWQKRLAAQIIANKTNSGKVTKQWDKGLAMAQGTIIWIAEADDVCEASFLEKMLAPFTHEDIILAYTIPDIIDANGELVNIDYRRNYLAYASTTRWQKSYCAKGNDEVSSALGIVNVAPNVSAVIFRKPSDTNAIDAAQDFICSGDWIFYLYLARSGRIAYVHEAKAYHRRHEESVIARDQQHKYTLLLKETECIHDFVCKNFQISTSNIKKMQKFRDSIRQEVKI